MTLSDAQKVNKYPKKLNEIPSIPIIPVVEKLTNVLDQRSKKIFIIAEVVSSGKKSHFDEYLQWS